MSSVVCTCAEPSRSTLSFRDWKTTRDRSGALSKFESPSLLSCAIVTELTTRVLPVALSITPGLFSMRMQSAKQLLRLLLVLLPIVGVVCDVPVPAPARKAWDQVLNTVWLKAKPRVAFCLGEGEAGVIKTMLESFPDPLPTEPAGDPVCSNATKLGEHLCGAKSLMEYYKV